MGGGGSLKLEFDESIPAWIFRGKNVNTWMPHVKAQIIIALRNKDRANFRSTEITIVFDCLQPEITTQKFTVEANDWAFFYESIGSSDEDEHIVYMYISRCPSTAIKQIHILYLDIINSLAYDNIEIYSISHTNILDYNLNQDISNIYYPSTLERISEYGHEPFFMSNENFNFIVQLANRGRVSMFTNLANLISIPSNLFVGCEEDADQLRFDLSIFCTGCSSLKSIPSKLFEPLRNAKQIVLNNAFSNCTSLTKVPSGLLSNLPIYQANSIFQNCTNLRKLPKDLFENLLFTSDSKYLDLSNAFSGCTNLADLNDGDMLMHIFSDGIYDGVFFNSTFAGCSSITGKLPELWNIYNDEVADIQYEGCFTDCINATNYKDAQDAGWA